MTVATRPSDAAVREATNATDRGGFAWVHPPSHAVVLLVLYLTTATAHLAWDAAVQRMPAIDQAGHLIKGIAFAESIEERRFLAELWDVPALYPPAYHLLLALAQAVIGPSRALGLYVNLVLLAVLMVTTYDLARQLAGRRVALLAAILTLSYPGVLIFAREALIEFCLGTITVIAIDLLLRTKEFQRTAACVLLGVAVGTGFLVKPTVAVYLWLPVGASVLRAFVVAPARPTLRHIVVTMVIVIAIAGIWYVPHIHDILLLSQANRLDARAFGHPADAWTGFLLLLRATAAGLTTPWGQWLTAVALIVSGVTAFRRLWIVHAWLVGTWVVLVFAITFRDDKYLLPTLPAAALLVAFVVERLRPPPLRTAVLCFVCAFQAISFAHAGFGWPPLPADSVLATRSAYAGRGGAERSVPDIVAAMDAPPGVSAARVGVVPNDLRLNASTLTWEARRTHRRLLFEHISYSGYHSLDGARRRARELEWVLLKTGAQGLRGTVDLAEALSRDVRDSPDAFERIEIFPAADGSVAELYRVRGAVVPTVSQEQIDAVVEASDPRYRDVRFGTRFRMLGLTTTRRTEGVWNSQGVVLRIAWQALAAGRLDRIVAVHLVDDGGGIRAQADYVQHRRGATVEQGAVWLDEILLAEAKLAGATGIGICLYHMTEPHLPIDRGPRDWNGLRLRVALPAERL
jgi:hypothetical protein